MKILVKNVNRNNMDFLFKLFFREYCFYDNETNYLDASLRI